MSCKANSIITLCLKSFSKELGKKKSICTCFFQPYRFIFPLFGIESQPSSLDSSSKEKKNKIIYLMIIKNNTKQTTTRKENVLHAVIGNYLFSKAE